MCYLRAAIFDFEDLKSCLIYKFAVSHVQVCFYIGQVYFTVCTDACSLSANYWKTIVSVLLVQCSQPQISDTAGLYGQDYTLGQVVLCVRM